MKKLMFFCCFLALLSAKAFCQTSPPVATQVELDGSASTDPDGSIVKYEWKQISGPATPVIVTPAGVKTIVKDYNTPGVYVYQLTVTDNEGASGTSTVQVTVLKADNIIPVSRAGANLQIQLPARK